MLVVVQFPISDARAFSTLPSARLDVPSWPAPQVFGNPQFIRSFGPAALRRGGPDAAWTDEASYCEAHRAIRFPGLRQARLRAGDLTVQPLMAFRRVFCTQNSAVSRVEIGITGRLAHTTLSQAAVEPLVRDVLGLDTRVYDPARKSQVTADLSDQALRLARLFALATSRRKPPGLLTPEDLRLVDFGRPMVVVEFDDKEVLAVPKGARRVEQVKVGTSELAFYDQRTPGGEIPVWVLRRVSTPEPVLRSFRLCLLRLHAERECLDRVLAHVNTGHITYDEGSPPSERLSQYLNDATAVLDRKWACGVDQSELLRAMEAAEATAQPNRTKYALDGIAGIRKQILRKVRAHELELSAPRVEAGGLLVDKRTVVNADGAHVGGNLIGSIEAEQITNSFNKVTGSDAPADVKAAVAQLQAAIEQVLPTLTKPEAEKVKASVDIIATQATATEPIEAFVQAAGKTLVEVGETVGELAKPISTAVNAVLKALKFAALLV